MNFQINFREIFEDYVSSDSECLNYSSIASNTFSSPHYNSFVDMNGDCRADIFITSTNSSDATYYEFWIKQNNGLFCLVNVTQATATVKGVTFTDIGNEISFHYIYKYINYEDFDGGIDMIVATEDSDGLWLELYFNNMAPSTDYMCAIRGNQKNCPFDQTASVFFNIIFSY